MHQRAQLTMSLHHHKGDEWYDTSSSSSSEGGQSPAKKCKSADHEDSIVTLAKPRSEEEARLLPYMPALFGTDLPPCGLEPQVAYETLNARLRESWLKHRGRRSAVDICEDEKEALKKQDSQWPPFSLKGSNKERKPWRREMVFKFELQWIVYFVHEARKHTPELMTESEIMDRKKYSSVPKGLKIYIHKQYLLKMWDVWNEKKRAKVPALPEDLVNEGMSDQEDKPQNQDIEKLKADTEGKDRASDLSESSDISIIHRPSFEGSADDAHLWSQSNHD
ncbi:hypothetical protein B0J11DRAFT_607848 [Dendryphion nanum]|uniref:Uncharacterized protein n=1 Tax=Dendryphion nanum TaxID=256645 RepID=A0A9P9IHQ3_9PLEO|nr:hypothetical protein B0J11DRAFT_607848 [Dendryphion nanum]